MVFQLSKSLNSQSASNVTVFLKDENAQIVDFCLTNEQGEYQFDKIPYGAYSIYVEKSGKNCLPVEIYLNEEKDSLDNINLTIQTNEIVSTPERLLKQADKILVYPNPFTNQLRIDLPTKSKFEISLVDLAGKVLYESKNMEGNTNLLLPKLEKGSYVLSFISVDNDVFVKKVIKK